MIKRIVYWITYAYLSLASLWAKYINWPAPRPRTHPEAEVEQE